MTYQVETNVRFDLCSLEGHDWVKASHFGLAHLIEQQRCSKCGETRVPRGELVGISREAWRDSFWRNIQ